MFSRPTTNKQEGGSRHDSLCLPHLRHALYPSSQNESIMGFKELVACRSGPSYNLGFGGKSLSLTWLHSLKQLLEPEWTLSNLPFLLLLLQLSLLFKAQLRRLLAFLEPFAFLFHKTLLSNFSFFSLRSMPIVVKKKCQFSTPSPCPRFTFL
jgi:hypothetical protein